MLRMSPMLNTNGIILRYGPNNEHSQIEDIFNYADFCIWAQIIVDQRQILSKMRGILLVVAVDQ
jgi:hypothetical protein